MEIAATSEDELGDPTFDDDNSDYTPNSKKANERTPEVRIKRVEN